MKVGDVIKMQPRARRKLISTRGLDPGLDVGTPVNEWEGGRYVLSLFPAYWGHRQGTGG